MCLGLPRPCRQCRSMSRFLTPTPHSMVAHIVTHHLSPLMALNAPSPRSQQHPPIPYDPQATVPHQLHINTPCQQGLENCVFGPCKAQSTKHNPCPLTSVASRTSPSLMTLRPQSPTSCTSSMPLGRSTATSAVQLPASFTRCCRDMGRDRKVWGGTAAGGD
jgi:hypothetical protein